MCNFHWLCNAIHSSHSMKKIRKYQSLSNENYNICFKYVTIRPSFNGLRHCFFYRCRIYVISRAYMSVMVIAKGLKRRCFSLQNYSELSWRIVWLIYQLMTSPSWLQRFSVISDRIPLNIARWTSQISLFRYQTKIPLNWQWIHDLKGHSMLHLHKKNEGEVDSSATL